MVLLPTFCGLHFITYYNLLLLNVYALALSLLLINGRGSFENWLGVLRQPY